MFWENTIAIKDTVFLDNCSWINIWYELVPSNHCSFGRVLLLVIDGSVLKVVIKVSFKIIDISCVTEHAAVFLTAPV